MSTVEAPINDTEITVGSSADVEESPVPSNPITPNALANVSTDSIHLVQDAPPTAEERAQAREKLLKDRALKRIERRERNHKLAEEAALEADALVDSGDIVAAVARFVNATELWQSNPNFYLKLTRAYIKCEHPTHTEALSSLGRTLTLLQATKLGDYVLSPPPLDTTSEGEPVDFAFPRYEDEKLELAERSDSSECNHPGNGVPCRFYNHDGCGRGRECEFSHAPDEKSVRDDLGKNVCLYFLLSACKFGDLKCIYSHSRDALPKHGWWNDPVQIKRVKGVLELAEKKAKEQRALEGLLYRLEGRKGGRGKGQGQRDEAKAKGHGRRGGDGEKRGGRGKSRGANTRESGTHTGEKEKVKEKEAVNDEKKQDKNPDSTTTNDDAEERAQNGGFIDNELNELAAQGVKPYDDDAHVRLTYPAFLPYASH
ncbi:hypothetical protein DXG03_000149 [Asterophora parasitica]|uniref:C3H1-type domain-containing protein n=1 Tax=Asterophora parasitica TaxID=117018 RepID=A0A9P7GGC2_9AGAR|nr:hypothetical protein DXG03_000149 [Asterophora parasitica]